MKNLDIYKVIILLSVLLLPGGWYWTSKLREQIRLTQDAYGNAIRAKGHLEQIGTLQKTREQVRNNRTLRDSVSQVGQYFETQFLASARGNVTTQDIKIQPIKIDSKTKTTQDVTVELKFDKKFHFSRDFLYAALFNWESGARDNSGASGQSLVTSIWKLRSLSIENATDDKLADSKSTPPLELDDRWIVNSMVFARREPRDDDKK